MGRLPAETSFGVGEDAGEDVDVHPVGSAVDRHIQIGDELLESAVAEPALEHGILHAESKALADLRDVEQTTLAGSVCRGDVIRDEDLHVALPGHVRRIRRQIAPQGTGEQCRLDCGHRRTGHRRT